LSDANACHWTRAFAHPTRSHSYEDAPTKTQAGKRKPSAARARSAAKAAPKALPDLAPPELEERDFIEAAVHLLGLAIEPAWKPAIEANFAITLRLAASFMDFPLPDEAEPAPVFAA
jgi:hypothetical protein